jgi:voltage-gated potassium channel
VVTASEQNQSGARPSDQTDVRSEAEPQELRERLASWLHGPLTFLGLVNLALVIVDLTALGGRWSEPLSFLAVAVWIVFGAAFFTQLLLAPSKPRYLRDNWLTAVAVLLPALRVLRVVRVLQSLRVLRGLSLLRIATALNRATRGLEQVLGKGGFGYVLAIGAVVTITGSAGVYYFERNQPGASIQNLGDALWWGLSILTTVNSQFEATTPEGRTISFVLRLFGLAVSGYVTAIIAAHLLGARFDRGPEAERELSALRAENEALRRALADEAGDVPRHHAA